MTGKVQLVIVCDTGDGGGVTPVRCGDIGGCVQNKTSMSTIQTPPCKQQHTNNNMQTPPCKQQHTNMFMFTNNKVHVISRWY